MSYDNAWLQEVFERRLPAAGFAVREEQLAMANFVHTALTRNRHLLAEAGVGTGKTFAYLIPAFAHVLRTGAPVLVATHTLALQAQLVHRDVPAVASLLGIPMTALLAKGREHFLCPIREFAFRDAQPEPNELEAALLGWARRTQTGDRDEAPLVPDALWSRVNLDEGRACAGCRYETTCPTAHTRRKWQQASGLVVTNHHQFFADLALRASGGHLFALPGAIVLDEAHALPDTAREMLGHRSGAAALAGACRAAAKHSAPDDARSRALADAVQRFFEHLAARVDWRVASDEAVRFDVTVDATLSEFARQLYGACAVLVERLASLRESPPRRAAMQRLEAASAPLRALLHPEAHVAWVEGQPRRGFELVSVPRDLGGILQTRLFSRGTPVVLTSATLSANGDFDYMRAELGLERPLMCAAGSPFDFERQARLYLADDMPDPAEDADAFYAAATERLQAALKALGGRVLVLYTAKSRLEAAHRALSAWGRVSVYRQDRADPQLLERFSREEHAVLLGTAYWEGLDLPGLSAVVVTKLPFPPEDPLLRARFDRAAAAGEDPFEAVTLPEMLLRLKQGTGRLIRRSEDRGVLVLLDPRALTRRYAEAVAEALPPAPRVDSLEAAAAFLHP